MYIHLNVYVCFRFAFRIPSAFYILNIEWLGLVLWSTFRFKWTKVTVQDLILWCALGSNQISVLHLYLFILISIYMLDALFDCLIIWAHIQSCIIEIKMLDYWFEFDYRWQRLNSPLDQQLELHWLGRLGLAFVFIAILLDLIWYIYNSLPKSIMYLCFVNLCVSWGDGHIYYQLLLWSLEKHQTL